jgi:hypothetical protein
MSQLSPRSNGKSVRCAPCWGLRRVMGRLWRKFVVDEEHSEKELVRQKRIDNIMHDVVLLEAMRRWKLEHKRLEVSKDSPFAKK